MLAAARLYKVLPLVLLLAIAALSRGTVRPLALVSASAFVFLVMVIGMHLNAITDRAVDRVRKPHLAEWTMSSPWMLRAVLTVETLASLVFLLIAAAATPSTRIVYSMVLFSILSTTYSFNIFIPARGGPLRGKIHWLSHALTIWGSYFCLWMIGFDCAAPALPNAASSPVLLALFLSLVDYGVFIQESANDWAEERAANFRTLPALWGHYRTSALGLVLVIVGAVLSWHGIGQLSSISAVYALQFLLGLEILGAVASAATAQQPMDSAAPDRRNTEQLIDIVFWGSRLIPLVLLLIG
jgi:4-hydroxybenzoate polyprenyltransferase